MILGRQTHKMLFFNYWLMKLFSQIKENFALIHEPRGERNALNVILTVN